jgi:hypothetical protein
MMDQDTANEDASDDSEDNLPTSKPISKKRKTLPISSEDEDSTDNLAKHGQRPSPVPLDDEEAVLNDLLGENDNDDDNNYSQVKDKDKDSNLLGLDDGGLDENVATQETSNSSAVLEDNGVYSSSSPTSIIY